MRTTISFLRNGALAVCFALLGPAMMPAPALADAGSTAAAIAIGAVVGQLLFDSGTNQYYYVDSGHHRHYVNDNTARAWYQHQDPSWYHSHQGDFRGNPGKFDRDFRGSHHPPHP
jgi:hypothetical protein